MAEDEDLNIPLSTMIEALRLELAVAARDAVDQDIQFEVDKVELELEMAIGRKTGGSGGLKFWVVTAEGRRDVERLVKHKFKLTLDAKHRGGERVLVADPDTGAAEFG